MLGIHLAGNNIILQLRGRLGLIALEENLTLLETALWDRSLLFILDAFIKVLNKRPWSTILFEENRYLVIPTPDQAGRADESTNQQGITIEKKHLFVCFGTWTGLAHIGKIDLAIMGSVGNCGRIGREGHEVDPSNDWEREKGLTIGCDLSKGTLGALAIGFGKVAWCHIAFSVNWGWGTGTTTQWIEANTHYWGTVKRFLSTY